MAGIRIKVGLKGQDEALEALRYLRNLGEDPEELLDVLGLTLAIAVRNRFDTGRGPGGVPWPVSRRAQKDGGKTLVDKGNLQDSVDYEVTAAGVEVGFKVGSQSSKFAYVLHYGAVITPKNGPYLVFTGPDGHKHFARSVTIPARPMLGIDDVDRRDFVENAQDHVRSKLK